MSQDQEVPGSIPGKISYSSLIIILHYNIFGHVYFIIILVFDEIRVSKHTFSDLSTFTTGHAHYGQFIFSRLNFEEKNSSKPKLQILLPAVIKYL